LHRSFPLLFDQTGEKKGLEVPAETVFSVIRTLAFKIEKPLAEHIIWMRIRRVEEALYMNSVFNFTGKALTLSTVHFPHTNSPNPFLIRAPWVGRKVRK
jgi:hypothetical protein